MGEGITAYYLDISIELPNSQFSNVFQQVLFGQHVKPGGQFGEGEYDTADDTPADHGGCKLSLIGGTTPGVARKAKLIHVKARLTAASMLSGLVQTFRHLHSREQAGNASKVKRSSAPPYQSPKLDEGLMKEGQKKKSRKSLKNTKSCLSTLREKLKGARRITSKKTWPSRTGLPHSYHMLTYP